MSLDMVKIPFSVFKLKFWKRGGINLLNLIRIKWPKAIQFNIMFKWIMTYTFGRTIKKSKIRVNKHYSHSLILVKCKENQVGNIIQKKGGWESECQKSDFKMLNSKMKKDE